MDHAVAPWALRPFFKVHVDRGELRGDLHVDRSGPGRVREAKPWLSLGRSIDGEGVSKHVGNGGECQPRINKPWFIN